MFRNLNQKRLKVKGWLLVAVAWLGVILVIAFSAYRQSLIDLISYWQYQPSEAVLNLSKASFMSPKAEFVFLASQPVLDPTYNLHQECHGVEDTVSVLGCYKDRQIYIFDVQDPEINQVKVVTAAHEMLHAVYARLSESERKTINELLTQEYLKLINHKKFAERLSAYAGLPPAQLSNELHSIIGTEIAKVSDGLEKYYQRYFTDRQKIVELNRSWLLAFESRQEESKKLLKEINQLEEQIKEDSALYNFSVNYLNIKIGTFNEQADQGRFASQAEFLGERAKLIKDIRLLETTREEINKAIDQYNQLLIKYNEINVELKELFSHLDSSLAPMPEIQGD